MNEVTENVSLEDTIENKEKIYGPYELQNEAIADIISSLDRLKRDASQNNDALTEQERVDYMFIVMKLTRTITAKGPSSVDSWLDLANYSRLTGRRRTGVDVLEELVKL